MSFAIQITGKVIHVVARELIVWSDVMELGKELGRIEGELEVSPNRVMDLSESAGADINFGVVSTFADKRNHAVLKNPVRVAVIATTDLHFGIARMFQAMVVNPQIEFRIFKDSGEAWGWVS